MHSVLKSEFLRFSKPLLGQFQIARISMMDSELMLSQSLQGACKHKSCDFSSAPKHAYSWNVLCNDVAS